MTDTCTASRAQDMDLVTNKGKRIDVVAMFFMNTTTITFSP